MNEKKCTAVIIDDEEECIDRIINSLAAYPGIRVVGTARNAAEGSRIIVDSQPDLIFADVEMPGKSGLSMIKEVQPLLQREAHVVYYSAHNQYILDALRSSAFDFLLKPYEEKEFDQIIQRWHAQIKLKNANIPSNTNPVSCADKIFIASTQSGYQVWKVDQFIFAEYISSKKVWSVTLSNQSIIFLKRGTTAEAIVQLSESFVQISQYCIINSNYLSAIIDGKCVMIPPFNENQLKITRTYLKVLQMKFEEI